jgi:hypothetical protein
MEMMTMADEHIRREDAEKALAEMEGKKDG